MTQREDPHEQRKRDEERIKDKANELSEAGKGTAHTALKEGEKKYEDVKVPFCITFAFA